MDKVKITDFFFASTSNDPDLLEKTKLTELQLWRIIVLGFIATILLCLPIILYSLKYDSDLVLWLEILLMFLLRPVITFYFYKLET